jgi:DnaK suppressor protein
MTGRPSDACTHTPAEKENRPVTTTANRPTELLRCMLEEQRRTHTLWLTQLMICGEPPDATGHDSATVEAFVAAARQGVADTTQALHRMEQGTYGVCEACGKNIPLGRLRNLPHARFCVPCQRRAAQRWSTPPPTVHSRGQTNVNHRRAAGLVRCP